MQTVEAASSLAHAVPPEHNVDDPDKDPRSSEMGSLHVLGIEERRQAGCCGRPSLGRRYIARGRFGETRDTCLHAMEERQILLDCLASLGVETLEEL